MTDWFNNLKKNNSNLCIISEINPSNANFEFDSLLNNFYNNAKKLYGFFFFIKSLKSFRLGKENNRELYFRLLN